MSFLDKLLGRNKAVAGGVADKGKKLAGDVKREATEDTIGHEHGGEGSDDDHTHGPTGGSAT